MGVERAYGASKGTEVVPGRLPGESSLVRVLKGEARLSKSWILVWYERGKWDSLQPQGDMCKIRHGSLIFRAFGKSYCGQEDQTWKNPCCEQENCMTGLRVGVRQGEVGAESDLNFFTLINLKISKRARRL